MMADTSKAALIAGITGQDGAYRAAQSYIALSFEAPEYAANAGALDELRLPESIRILGLEKNTGFCQANTSEPFGKPQQTPQRGTGTFHSRSAREWSPECTVTGSS